MPIGSHTKAASLDSLFRAKTIAVIGASEEENSVGWEVMHNLAANNYQGTLYPVNPKYADLVTRHVLKSADTVMLPYLRDVEELPDEGIDLALMLVPAPSVPAIVERLGQKRVKALVVISAGFAEAGEEGRKRQNELQRVLDRYPMTLVGPNCLGIANTDREIRLNATFTRGSLPSGYGAIFSQSGAIGIDLMNRFAQAGLGFCQFISLGNSLSLRPQQLLEAWQDDPKIHYVLGYLESGFLLSDLRETAGRFTRSKPILLIKAGRSRTGSQAAKSHTGALAGSEEAVNALLQQCGIQRFASIEDLMAAAQAFERCPPIRGNRVAVLSNAGGYAVMTSDLLETQKADGLTLAKFSETTLQQLNNLLPEMASDQNPLDTTATFPVDQPDIFREILALIAQDSQVDACLVELVEILDIRLPEILHMLDEVQRISKKPVICACSPRRQEVAQEIKPLPVAVYGTLKDAVVALEALNRQRTIHEKPLREQSSTIPDLDPGRVEMILSQAYGQKRSLLTTAESLSILQAYGIHSPGFSIVQDLKDAKNKANSLGYPLAIKLNSKTVTHKTEVGGVRLDIRNEIELEAAFNGLMEKLRQGGTHSFEEGEGLMLQEYLPTGRELILGIKSDPDFGKLILIGRGGIYTQIDQDFQVRLAPASRDDVQEMIHSLKAYPILAGYRGKPGIDFQTLEDSLLRLSALATGFPQISELDINPYLARPIGDKPGMAVDARIIIE